MKKIPLTQGKFALVDDEDYKNLSQWKWYTFKSRGNFYAERGTLKSEKILATAIKMHRYLMGAQLGDQLDHINGNSLDNRKCNLRICTHKQNSRNSRLKKNNSGYKGVFYHKATKKYSCSIRFRQRTQHLGTYQTAVEAAKIYDRAALKYYKEFARTNKMLGLL